jgi:hypothetical protein
VRPRLAHTVPPPLLATWLSWTMAEARAGAAVSVTTDVSNAGTVTWGDDIAASYHWLDPRGNAIVWDGRRTPLPRAVAPGEHVTLQLDVRAPMPPGRYLFALDLVAEHRAWFGELGSEAPLAEVEVLPRVDGAGLAEVATAHLPPAVEPEPGWEERVLALHSEGFAVVAGAVDGPRRLRRELALWAPGGGRVPGFPHPLLCPSVLHGVELQRSDDVAGLPAFLPPADEPWVYDASLVLRLS